MTPAVPSVQKSRLRLLSGKVFSSKDLQRVAQIFNEQALQSKDAGHSAAVEYEVQLADRTRLKSESLKLFDDDSVNSMERPVRVEMIFVNVPLKRSLSLSLEHGPDNLNNWTSVKAYEEAWFNDLTTKFADAMGKVPDVPL